MSIIIRVKATGDVFDVPPAPFALEMKNTSPIFNDLGSKTVATGLPITPKNCRIFGFANRLDIDQKPNSVIEVIVSHGSYTREGVLYLSAGYNTEKSFPITIAFNEGIMYQTMEDLLLPKLKMPIREFNDFESILAYMNRLFSQDATDEELSVFPVYLKTEKYTYEYEGNEYEQIDWIKLNLWGDDLSKLKVVDRTDIVVDGKLVNISVPPGYGITPFVRVWRMLELIFEHFGYRVKSNPFKEHFQLKRLCVLNNVADAIVWNEIDYAQLMPNITVMEFLESLYCRFGLKVFFDGNKNEVNLRLLKDIFANNDADKMNLGSELDPEIAVPKQIKLSAAKNLEYSKTEFDTYEEFLAKYNNTADIIFDTSGHAKNEGILYYLKTGFFYQNPIRGQEKKISSIHFDWNKNEEGFKIEEITSIDECITMWEGESHVPHYAIDARLAYSDLGITKHNDDGESSKQYLDIMQAEAKLAFIYDMGLAYDVRDNIVNYWGMNYGSIFPYEASASSNKLQKDKDGNEFIYSLTMVGEHGAFNQFHKAHDAFLRHSNRLVKFEINTLPYELSDIDYSKKKIIQNQPVLLDKVDYNIGQEKNMINATIEARSLHLYKPYDLEKEQFISKPEPIFSKWDFYNSRNDRINDKLIERRSYWMRWCEAAGFKFISYDIAPKSIIIQEPIQDPNPPSDLDMWFLPPTREQLNSHAKIGESKHNCKIICQLVYEVKMIGDQYEYEGFSIDYIGEFNAVPI